MSVRPWHKDYEPDPGVQGRLVNVGRRPQQTQVDYRHATSVVDVDGAFFGDHTLDKARFPVADEGDVLDTAFLAARLQLRDATLSTIVQSRQQLCASHDACLAIARLDPSLRCDGDYGMLDMARCVGAVMPVWGPCPLKVATTTTRGPFLHGASSTFAHRAAILSTTSDCARGDQGEIVALVVTLTGRLFNFGVDDARRVRLGSNPLFEDTCAWVLVVHAFAPAIPYTRLNRQAATRRRRDEDDPFEAVFLWEAYAAHNAARLGDRGWKISTFALKDTTQTGKDMIRAVLPWPVAHCAGHLDLMRAVGLRDKLLTTPMKTDQAVKQPADRTPGGLDLRRMLLMELVLRGTPLEGMWTGGPVTLPPCPTALRAADLHDALLRATAGYSVTPTP